MANKFKKKTQSIKKARFQFNKHHSEIKLFILILIKHHQKLCFRELNLCKLKKITETIVSIFKMKLVSYLHYGYPQKNNPIQIFAAKVSNPKSIVILKPEHQMNFKFFNISSHQWFIKLTPGTNARIYTHSNTTVI